MQELSSQICATHIELIEQMAHVLDQRQPVIDVTPLIDRYRTDGWLDLSRCLTTWLEGIAPDTDELDQEDAQIVAGIQRAMAEPAWLASLADQARQEAANGVATLIFAGTWGDHDALEALSHMREATRESGLENSAADAFIAIVEGERELEKLLADHPQADPDFLRAVFERFRTLEAQ